MRDHRDSHNFFFFGGGRDTAWHVGSNLCPLHRKAVLTNGLLGKSPFHTYILECQVKWALRSTAVNKASGCNEIPELFKSLMDDAIKALYSLCQQIWKIQQWPQDCKRSVVITIPKFQFTTKNVLTIGQLYSSPMLIRSCLKSCMLGFSIMQIKNFQMSKLGLEKEEELESKLPTSAGL